MTSTAPPRILVVEDSPTQAEEVRLILESGGFPAETAPDARRALERLADDRFGFVVSDILMPGISGFDLCRRIKEHPVHRHVPVLLLTSLAEPIDVMHALECGADSFVSKPYDAEHLLKRVKSLLESRRLNGTGDDYRDMEVLFEGRPFRVPSDRRQVLDLLVSSFEDMVRRNAELGAARDALEAKHEQLRRAERQKEELAALVVHDLKSPASGIMMAAQSRLRSPELPRPDRDLWGMIYTSAEIINRMVMNLLDIAGSADVPLEPRVSDLDLRRLVQEVRQLMRPVADTLGQEITVILPAQVPPVQGDHELLRRVLQNLVDNALRNSPRGGEVRIEAELSPDALALRVRDAGPGVPPALRERIFDRYVRGERQREGTSSGKGLGLAFCRMAVVAHGGRIWVEDSQPQGSLFTVEIPVRQAARAAQVG